MGEETGFALALVVEVIDSAGEIRPVNPIATERERAVEGLGGGRIDGFRDGSAPDRGLAAMIE